MFIYIKFFVLISIFVFAFGACHHVQKSNDSDSDSAAPLDDTAPLGQGTDERCINGHTLCESNRVYICNNNSWQLFDDCTRENRFCSGADNIYACEHAVDTDTTDPSTAPDIDSNWDSDTDTATPLFQLNDALNCNTVDTACDAGCWTCGAENPCAAALDACSPSNDVFAGPISGCAALLACRTSQCCDSKGKCLEGEAMADCIEGCSAAYANVINNIALKQFQDWERCMVCNICPNSCKDVYPETGLACDYPDDINTPDTPCYDTDAESAQTSCHGWAVHSGPCEETYLNCLNAPGCIELNACLKAVASGQNNDEDRQECYDAADWQAEGYHRQYMECIYCFACDEACADMPEGVGFGCPH